MPRITSTAKPRVWTVCAVLAAGYTGTWLRAQTPAGKPKPEPDVLILNDGEKLIGHLESAKGDSVTFKSDAAGEVTIDWSKIKELRTASPFAVIGKNVKLNQHGDVSKVPQGNLSATDQRIGVEGKTPGTVAVKDTAFVVAQPDFEKAMDHKAGILADWGGTVTGGLSLVEATQNARTFTGGVSLVRAEPTESWLNPSTRTTIDFTASYGKVSQPGLPTIKTAIYHGDAEEDKYFTTRLFVFGQAAFDHNYSQGLNLQQTYGGGLGWTAVKSAADELDVKGSFSYINQNFNVSTANQSLAGSTFAEIYTRKFGGGIVLTQQLSATPAWNNLNAYFANGGVTLAVPVHKRLSLSLAALDTFLNDPPAGFKKNSFQFTAGISYALK